MGAQQEESAELYDGVAQLWRALYGEHVHVGYYPDVTDKSSVRLADAQDHTVEQIIKAAGLDGSVRKVLDVGCGVGGTGCLIARALGCAVEGVNISKEQVAMANALARGQGFPESQVRFVEGDAMALPESVGSADVVLAFESACYMPDKAAFIQQLASRLEPGGTLLLVDFCRGPEKLSPQQASYLARMDGLFATAGGWTSAEEYARMMAHEGLRLEKTEDWSDNIKGFWEASLVELFTAVPGINERGLVASAPAILKKLLYTGYCVVANGWPTIKMALTFLTASQRRIVRGAFDSGALRYQLLVATKPPAAA